MNEDEERTYLQPMLTPDSEALVRFWVPGEPKPQGSMRGFSPKGSTFVNMTSDNKGTKDWRADVKSFALQQMQGRQMIVDEPVFAHLYFVVKRIKSLPKTKATPPAVKKPDLDKLTRAIYDALTGIVYQDDSLVTEQYDDKRIAEIGEQPGCWIVVGRRVGNL